MTDNHQSSLRASNALIKTAIELLEDSITMLEGQFPDRAQAIKQLVRSAEDVLGGWSASQ